MSAAEILETTRVFAPLIAAPLLALVLAYCWRALTNHDQDDTEESEL